MTEQTQARDTGGCPATDTDYRIDRPLFWNYESLGAVREEAPVTWNTSAKGFWMVNRYEEVKEAFRMEDVFTNERVNAFDPEMELRLLPQNLTGEAHRKFRAVLNPWFSPGAVKRMDDLSRSRCTALIDEMAPRGSCDFVADFGILYPTEVFLTLIGLPVTDGAQFVRWVESIFGGFFDSDGSAAEQSAADVTAYFDAAVADRAKSPRDPDRDFVSYMLQASIDGEPIPREEIVTTCLTVMLAGLDTTRSALGYIWHHLATHEADRRRIGDEPEFLSRAVEEFRLYSLLIEDGRLAAHDVDFHGCPMKKGTWCRSASSPPTGTRSSSSTPTSSTPTGAPTPTWRSAWEPPVPRDAPGQAGADHRRRGMALPDPALPPGRARRTRRTRRTALLEEPAVGVGRPIVSPISRIPRSPS